MPGTNFQCRLSASLMSTYSTQEQVATNVATFGPCSTHKPTHKISTLPERNGTLAVAITRLTEPPIATDTLCCEAHIALLNSLLDFAESHERLN